MAWCNACGGRTPQDATFCPSCGVRLPVDGAQRSVEAALAGVAPAQTNAPVAPGPRAWYSDPAGIARLRWWTGEAWSHVIAEHPHGPPRQDANWAYAVPASWLPDPLGRAPWRWWDGQEFTFHLSEGTTVWRETTTGPESY
jgi:hypothetical protein